MQEYELVYDYYTVKLFSPPECIINSPVEQRFIMGADRNSVDVQYIRAVKDLLNTTLHRS